MVSVALFVFIGRVAGAAKEMAVAYRYGVGTEVDGYLFVFNLVSWPVGVWFSALTVVLVPLAIRLKQNATTELPRFRSELLGITLMIGLILGVISWLGLPLLLRAHWTGLPPVTAALASGMIPGFILIIPLGVLISLFSAWMLATGRHTNTLMEGIPALVIALVVLAFANGGIKPLVWGTLTGFAFHLICLAISLGRRGEIETPCFAQQSPQWPIFWQGFGIMVASQALMSFTGVVDQFFAAPLGTGAIATLGYANRILALLLGLGATAVSRATLPVFSEAQTQGVQHLHHIAKRWVQFLFMLGMVATIVVWWFAPCAVKLLFERGAFTSQDTSVVTDVLRYGLVQLPFYYASMVLVSMFASTHRHKFIAISSVINLCVKVSGNFVLVPTMGIKGIIMATGIMYLFSSAFLYYFTSNFIKETTEI
jgi:peptidoglycan biosynthesis protein MviN/MurJ (putative lipid II flippase)